jgi:ribosomal subunit interface protein
MKMIITARHCDIPDDLRERATELVEKTAKLAVRPHRAEIIFDDDHQKKIVELQLYLVGGQVRVCKAEASDFRTALDRALDKLRNQLDKSQPSRRAAAE